MNRTDAHAEIDKAVRKSTRRTRRDGTTAALLLEVADMYRDAEVAEAHATRDEQVAKLQAQRDQAKSVAGMRAGEAVTRLNDLHAAIAERDQARAECEELGRQVAALRDERRETDQALRAVTAERNNLRGRCEVLEYERDGYSAERDRLREQLAAMTAERDMLRQHALDVGNAFAAAKQRGQVRVETGLPPSVPDLLPPPVAAPAADVPPAEATRAPQPPAAPAEGSSKGRGRKTAQKPAQRDGGSETEGFTE